MDHRSIGLVLFALLITGCGGGGGGDGGTDPGPQDLVLVATASMDGYAADHGAVWNNDQILVGDIDKLPGVGVGCRGLLSFDLSAIPAGATIESATLRLQQIGIEGDPFSNHGAVVVVHADYGDSLTSGDYTCPIFPATPVIISDSVTPGSRTGNVLDHVLADLSAGRTRTQLRLQFNALDTDIDSFPDFVYFDDSEPGAGIVIDEPPRIFLTYRP